MQLFNRSPKSKPTEVTLTITVQTFAKVVVLIIATVVLLAALRQATHAMVLIFIAFFLALALNAPVHWFAHHFPGRLRGSRTAGTVVAFLIVIGLLGGFFASILPPIVQQTQSLVANAPGLVNDLRDSNSDLGQFVQRYNLEDRVSELSDDLSGRVQALGGQAFSTISSVGSSAVSVLTVLVLTFMMVIEGPRWKRAFSSVVPPEHGPMADRLARSMYRVVKGYVNGQVVLAAIAAVTLLIPLAILGISYPVALMFVVFVCGLIPMVGHTIGAVIVTLVALFTSLPAALAILGFYFLYQQIENYVIQPRVQANSTDMSPLLVFVAVVVGVSFSGLLGGLVAIPIAGCLRILIIELLERNGMIHDPAVDAKAEAVLAHPKTK